MKSSISVPPTTPPMPTMKSASRDQRNSELVGLISLALHRFRLVADHHRRLRVHGVAVGQPGVQDALDEFLVGAGHLGRQRHPHALHQWPAPHEAARVHIRARQPRRDHLQRTQLVVCDLPVGPLAPLRRPQWQPDFALACANQRRLENLGQHQSIVERIMRLHLADTPVRRKRLQPHVVDAEVEPSAQLHRAHDAVDGQLQPGQFGFGSKEGVVEGHVVGDERAAAQNLGHLGGDIGECRLSREHLGGQAVHMSGSGIDTGIQQAWRHCVRRCRRRRPRGPRR